MNWPTQPKHSQDRRPPSLQAIRNYLGNSGWHMINEDSRSSVWHAPNSTMEEFVAVLPATEEISDYGERVYDALRTVAFVERRSIDEIVSDVSFGAADTVAARLAPDAPPGEAPLGLAYSAMSALRSYVIGSGSALDNSSLVLPTRRPIRAESYASRVRFSTYPGSFIMALALPLVETFEESRSMQVDSSESDPQGEPQDSEDFKILRPVQEPLLDLPPEPFGRRITNRMVTVARRAQLLADSVNTGDQPLRVFGEPAPGAANATELEALSGLGGPDKYSYRLRFAQSPLGAQRQDAVLLQITPGQQRVMEEAAAFLRTQQPRPDIRVQGIVVRLSRVRPNGPGVVVIEGVGDDSGTTRRFYAELVHEDYLEALRAHREGYRVIAHGDLVTRGSYKWLLPLRSFAIVPGLGDQD